MNKTTTKQRTISIAFSTNGFGYAVMEGITFVDYGLKRINRDKNAQCFTKAEKLIARYQPDVLVLQDVNAKDFYRAPRIKTLHKRIVALAQKRKIKVITLSGTQVRTALLNDPKGTRHDVAAMLANQFPDELGSRLPPKRRAWENEDRRMDIFDAVGLAVVSCRQLSIARLPSLQTITGMIRRQINQPITVARASRESYPKP